VRSLSFSRFLQLRRFILISKKEELREKFILAAYTAWQLGAGSGKKFGEYLDGIGLSDKETMSEPVPKVEEMSAKDAIAKAEEILRKAAAKSKAK